MIAASFKDVTKTVTKKFAIDASCKDATRQPEGDTGEDRGSIPKFWGAGGDTGEGRYGPEASQVPRWSFVNRA